VTTIEFIKNGLEALAAKFPQVEIRYAFNLDINTHIIQFDPLEAYYNLPELDAEWIPFSLEFDRKYEDESIAFIGSDSTLAISDNYEFAWNVNVVDVTFEGFKELLALSNFSSTINFLPNTVVFSPGQFPVGNLIENQIYLNNINALESNFFFTDTILSSRIELLNENTNLMDNDKYAMAA
jgi:hypothetical protein